MSQKFWRTNQFETLKAEWEKKLKESGFEDAEADIGGERHLKQRASNPYAHRYRCEEELPRESKLTYFLLIAQMCAREQDFKDTSDRLIMERTSEGWTITEISKELKKRALFKHNRDTIRYIRRRYEAKWGIRIWSREQMVSRRVRIRS